MSSRLLIVGGLLAAVLTACPPPKGACEDDSECEGGFCSTVCNCCIYPADGRFTGIAFVAPDAGALFGANAEMTVQVELRPASEEGPSVLQLTLTNPGGETSTHELVRAGTQHEGTILLGSTEGEYSLKVNYEGLESPVLTVKVDANVPTLEMEVLPAEMPNNPENFPETTWDDAAAPGARKVDEEITVLLKSADADFDAASVVLTAQMGMGAAVDAQVMETPGECGSGMTYCATATVLPWKTPPMDMRGELKLAATGSDAAGNVAQASRTVKVTRLKWTYDLKLGSDTTPREVIASPAVAKDGTIVVGTKTGGKLVAIKSNGEKRWETTPGAISASPAIGQDSNGDERIYFSVDTLTGPEPRFGSVGTGAGAAPCGKFTTGTALGSPAIVSMPEPGETHSEGAVFVINDVGNGTVAAMRPEGDPDLNNCRKANLFGNLRELGSVVSDGVGVYFGNSTGKIVGLKYTSGTGWATKVGWPDVSGIFAHSLAMSGNDVVGAGGKGGGGLFALKGTDTSPWTWQPMEDAETWNPVVDSTGRAWIGDGLNMLNRIEIRGSGTALGVDVGGTVKAAPLLGEGKLVYALTTAGVLQVRRTTDMSLVWSAAMPHSGTYKASPNIGCARDWDGARETGKPGVLYITGDSGKVYAITVESEWLDVSAPWPKYQRDPRNTGNSTTDWTEFGCD